MATREEIWALMEYIGAEFGTFLVTPERHQVWAEQLHAVSPVQLKRGIDFFMQNSGSTFGPTVSELLKAVRDSAPLGQNRQVKRLEEHFLPPEEGLERLRKLLREKFPEVVK